jgi:hypothetical protein
MKNLLKVISGVIFFAASIMLVPLWFAYQTILNILAGAAALFIMLTSKNN